jgi:hypothetical protein
MDPEEVDEHYYDSFSYLCGNLPLAEMPAYRKRQKEINDLEEMWTRNGTVGVDGHAGNPQED